MPATILWWGRFDPDYSRNRIIRQLLRKNGYRVEDFRPRSSLSGSIEAFFSNHVRPDAVWVPTFRHRDFPSARRFADKYQVPLIFDPLISSWDKVVFEREKFSAQSWQARRLLKHEQEYFGRADLVVADTGPHAQFFIDTLGASEQTTRVIPVGAEEAYFKPSQERSADDEKLEVLFYGSYINLQGPEVIVEAASRLPGVNWTLLGAGPLRTACELRSEGCSHIRFEDWLPYEELPERIARADILLGIFGPSAKAGRVIPNKVYQALACGRPLITRESAAYPAELGNDMTCGITFIPPNNPDALGAAVQAIAHQPGKHAEWGHRAHLSYQKWFSELRVEQALLDALSVIGL